MSKRIHKYSPRASWQRPPCSEEKKQKIAASLRGRKLSAEHRAAISRGLQGNKRGPYSAEHRAAIVEGLKGRKLSKEHRAKVSASLIGNQRRKGIKHTEETKHKMSEAHRKLFEDPEYRKWFAGTRNSYTYGIRSPYTDRNGRHFVFRSTWELAAAKLLDSVNLTWVYEDSSFHYEDEEGKPRVYTPDFFVKEWNCYIEIHPKFAVNTRMLFKLEEVRSRGLVIWLVTVEPKVLSDLLPQVNTG